MHASFDEKGLLEAVGARLLDGHGASGRLGFLIDVANIHGSLLHLSKFESIRFRPDPAAIKPLKPPSFDRLVLVLPPSYEVNWMISVAGYFDIAYKNLVNPVPHRAGPFRILYSAVIVMQEGQATFRNEQIKLT